MKKQLFMAWLALAALSLTVADALFGFTVPAGVTVTVPQLCGLAEEALPLPDGMTCETDYRYSDTVPAGTVMEQSPVGGSRVRVSDRRPCVIRLTVSLGAEERKVPNVIGMEPREAAACLREQGFSVREVTVKEDVPRRVLSTEPSPGVTVPAGSEITLHVSMGAAAESVELPDLKGRSTSSALMELFRLGLTVESVTHEASEVDVGIVIGQSPPGGSLVVKGAGVRLTVSTGSAAQQNDNDMDE